MCGEKENQNLEKERDTQIQDQTNHKDQTKETRNGKEMQDIKVKTSERRDKAGDRKPGRNACDVSG